MDRFAANGPDGLTIFYVAESSGVRTHRQIRARPIAKAVPGEQPGAIADFVEGVLLVWRQEPSPIFDSTPGNPAPSKPQASFRHEITACSVRCGRLFVAGELRLAHRQTH